MEVARTVIKLAACPRCKGAVLDYRCDSPDSPLCLNCGWRPVDIPPDVQEEVQKYLGKSHVDDRYIHRHIGTGKPPLSGWEREKRRRERQRREQERGR